MKKMPFAIGFAALLSLSTFGLCASLPSVPTSSPAGSAPVWVLDWSDEFAGVMLDHTKWVEDTGAGGWGNNELEYYTSRTENVRVADGVLVIEALKESYKGSKYTSARITTSGLRERTYGRYEARIKLPSGQGIWPAFWLLGTNFNTAGWPQCGEIDVMENIGKLPSTVFGTLHGPGYSGSNGFNNSYTPGSGNFSDAFHIFAVEWEPTEVRWYVDSTLIHRATPDLVKGTWVFQHPFYLILNLAVGGDWPGNPDQNTVFPQQMLVDYVRVYRRAN